MRHLFHGGVVHPGLDAPAAGWLLVEDGTVARYGSGEPPAAHRSTDLDGGTLVPAFRDAHVHLPATGLYASGLDFRGEHSASVITGSFAAQAATGGLLFGGNFEDPLDGPLDRRSLDEAVGDKPALLARADMHSAIVSSALLRSLDVDRLEGVDRDDSGPTGYLREQAAAEAWRWFESNLPPAAQTAAIQGAVQLAYSKGVAEVHEMFVVEWRGWDSAELFDSAVKDVALVVKPFFATTDIQKVQEMGLSRIGGDWFLDGSFGSHTAWMREPYPSEVPAGSSPTGISYRSDDEVVAFFMEAQEAGLTVGVHAIGDAAIEQCIASWEKVAEKLGSQQVRASGHRIEHFECATDDHILRAARLGLRASVQPAFDHFWGGTDKLYSKRIGWERARVMNRFRSMLDGGLLLAAGSDSTVTPLDPFLQMHALRSHHLEEQRLDPATALKMHTWGPAAVEGEDHLKGSLLPGMVADLALLDRDPLGVDAEDLLRTEVMGTWIGGQRVWPPAESEGS